MKLLHIDSSILGGQSISRQLTASIVAHLKQTTRDLEITYRDLAIAPVPQQSPTIQFAKMKALICRKISGPPESSPMKPKPRSAFHIWRVECKPRFVCSRIWALSRLLNSGRSEKNSADGLISFLCSVSSTAERSTGVAR